MKGKTNSWFGLILATGLAAVFIAHDLPAAKPGKPGGSSPPPPPPPGRIYAQSDYDVWGMKSDGSQASIEAFIDADWYRVQPSFARYGSDGHRWFLVQTSNPSNGETTLYATITGAEWIPLTDFGYSSPLVDEQGNVTRTLLRLLGDVSWSNDSLDQFISMPLLYAEQLLVIDEFNNEQWTTTYVERSIFQWDVSAADLEQFDPEPLSSIDDERLTWCLVTTAAGVQFPAHHWSPDGSQLVYHVQPPGVSPDEVRVVQVSGNGPVDAEDGELLYLGGLYTIIDPPQWSRHANSSDQRIVFAADGAVRTVRPNGSGLQSVATSDIAPGSNPRWSPDGQHLVYRGRTQKGLKVTWTINRIPGGGGTPTVIYSGVTSRIPLGWVAE